VGSVAIEYAPAGILVTRPERLDERAILVDGKENDFPRAFALGVVALTVGGQGG
jgi:hypothetical protein